MKEVIDKWIMETSMQRTEGNKKKSNEYKKSRERKECALYA